MDIGFKALLLERVAPSAGCIVCVAMFTSPIFGVQNVVKLEAIGDFNPLPAMLGLFNCVGWIGYCLTNGDLFVFFANGPGFLISAYMVLSTYPYVPKKQRNMLLWLFLSFSALTLGVAIAGVKMLQNGDMNLPGLQTMWGLTANFILVCFYAAPLSTLVEVLRTRNSASIYAPLSVCAMTNSTLWMLYGLAVKDYFISAPNAVGWVFSAIQLLLRAVIPQESKGSSKPNASPGSYDYEEGLGSGAASEKKRLVGSRKTAPSSASAD